MTTATRARGDRRKPTREFLRQVAHVYREAEASCGHGDAAVAEEFKTSRRAAERWVGLARQVGELEAG